MLHCPECGGNTQVLESRDTYRGRRCLNCKAKFKTVETIKNDDEDKFVKVPVEMYEAVSSILKQLQRDQRLKAWPRIINNNN